MVDIARLGIEVDARQATAAADALNRLTATGGRAETQTRNTSAAFRQTSGTLAGLSASTAAASQRAAVASASLESLRLATAKAGQRAAVASASLESFRLATARAGQRADSTAASLESLRLATARAGKRAAVASASLESLRLATDVAGQRAQAASIFMDKFAASTANAGAKSQAAGAGLGGAGTAATKAGTQFKGAASHTANLAAQFNDIGVQLAAGQSPLILAIQQGTQINQVLAQMGQRGGALKSLGAAFTSIVSPVSLLTIGLIAGGAALAQWAIKAATAGRDTRSLADLTDDLRDSTDAYIQASDAAGDSIESLAEQYGTKLAPRMREIRQLQTEIEQGFAQIDLDAFSDAFERQITNPKLGGIIRNTFRGGLRDLFELGDAPQRMQHFLEDSLKRVRELTKEYDKVAGNANKQLPILDEIISKLAHMSREVNDQNKEELELLDLVNKYREAAAENVAIELKTLEVKGERVKLSERDAKWAETTLERMRQQAAISQAVAAHGADSAQVVEQQAQATRDVLAADIERRDITGELAQSLRDALESEIRSGALADDRIQQDQDLLDLKNKLKQDALDDLATAKQRQHAEASIAQRLANRIEMARAIVVHGKDSIQAKLAEEAVSRRLFELELERAGITGDIRDQLIAQYEAAATLEGQIVAAQPAFQALKTTIDGISNAWAEWVVRGFDDFKSFTKSVLDSFKQLLVQMISTAAKNRIMLSLGIGGGLAGTAAADGGGLLGGGMGGLGKMLGPLSKMFGGGGGGGGGGLFSGPWSSGPMSGGLKNAGFNLGLFTGPNIASGAVATAAGGAVAGGAGGFGAFGLAGGAPVSGVAAGGLTTLGVAVPIIAGAALLFMALKSKTKILDSGITLAIDGTDTLVESFTKIEKSRFFGLSKKRSTRTGAVSEEVSDPIIQAVDELRGNLLQAADVLGFGSESIQSFSTDIELSFKDLSEEAQKAKLQEAFTEIGDGMAGAALEGTKLAEKFGNTAEAMLALAVTFATVNEVLSHLSMPQFATGEEGVGAAADLSQRFGGPDALLQAGAAFQELFHSEAERVQQTVRLITESLAGLNVALPDSMAAFRELTEAQNLNTEAGRELYATLLQIAPQFAAVREYERQLADEREASVRQALETTLETTHEMLLGQVAASIQDAQAAAASVQGLQFSGGRSAGSVQDAVGMRGSTTGPDRELLELDIFRRVAGQASSRGRQAQAASSRAANTALEARAQVEEAMAKATVATNNILAASTEEAKNLATEARDAAVEMGRQAATTAKVAAEEAARYAAIARGQHTFAAFSSAIRFLNLNLDIASKSAYGAAQNVVRLTSGTDEFQKKVNSYYASFFSQGEQLQNLQNDLTLSFRELGLALPNTRREFRALVEAQDLTTKAGQESFAGLIDLSQQFAYMTGEANRLSDALGGSQRHFRNLREEAFVRSATPGASDSEDARQTSTSDPLFLELIRAINQGNVRVERELEDLRRETRRNNREPTRQTVT